MRHNIKQKKIEEKTESIIDDLANEFNLNFKSYPEIYWVGNKKEFESLGISEGYKAYFNNTKREKSAIYLYTERIIITSSNKNEVLGEEAGHFLHFENSGINPTLREMDNPFDAKAMNILAESIGFFCSKLIDSRRKSDYSGYNNFRDFIYKILEKNKISYNNLEEKVWQNSGLKDEFFIYKHGYDLGNELFNNYLAGNISKKQIRNLMKNNFKEDFSATEKFLYLRKRFMKNNLSN